MGVKGEGGVNGGWSIMRSRFKLGVGVGVRINKVRVVDLH